MTHENHNGHINKTLLPVDIVLAPEWWNKHTGITFDPDFFFHPARRIDDEQKMEKTLYERWGKYGLGLNKNRKNPQVGAVHLASGFLLSEMLGCDVEYTDNHPPQVISSRKDDLTLDVDAAFKSAPFKKFENMLDALKKSFGYLTGDVNWGGILNIALDMRSENIFLDMMMQPQESKIYFHKIAKVIEKFTLGLAAETGTTSISVNRNVRHLKYPIFLHSECSHTMISTEDYARFLMEFDLQWSERIRPFGIHYCGSDPHRHAENFAKIPNLDFLDVGWGGDLKILRKHLPNAFLNIRLSPVEIAKQSADEIRETITRLVSDSANPYLTGVCCINMDDKVSDEKITAIFETVEELRKLFAGKRN
ncbi:MAG: hypothetical protein GWP06_06975 [Actinobacteria bacterium]|nr:hypothetical protein [Actinomycetota bacterium]